MPNDLNRRRFLSSSLATSAGVGLTCALGASTASAELLPGAAGATPPAASKDALPKAKIGNLEVSRLLLGGNLLTHFTHSRELRYVYNLAKHYNTEEKILETMAVAESHGINTLVIHTAPNVMNFLKKYREKQGGKIQWIICTTAPMDDTLVQFSQDVQKLADDGVDSIYVWGVRADALIKQDKVSVIGKAVELIKAQGLPAGVGAHALKVVTECEKAKIPADFYVKTFHHHDYPSGPKPDQLTDFVRELPGYWCRDPEETRDFMKNVKKPWIAFKVMAAGAIPPRNAFKYAFENGADCILAGMFDYEIAEDVQIARDTIAAIKTRPRPWCA